MIHPLLHVYDISIKKSFQRFFANVKMGLNICGGPDQTFPPWWLEHLHFVNLYICIFYMRISMFTVL